MSYHQRPHELRLAISSEAEALISDFGGDAYAEAVTGVSDERGGFWAALFCCAGCDAGHGATRGVVLK